MTLLPNIILLLKPILSSCPPADGSGSFLTANTAISKLLPAINRFSPQGNLLYIQAVSCNRSNVHISTSPDHCRDALNMTLIRHSERNDPDANWENVVEEWLINTDIHK